MSEPDIVLNLNSSAASRALFKVRLTLGPALIDFEGTLEEVVTLVTRLMQEFTKGPASIKS